MKQSSPLKTQRRTNRTRRHASNRRGAMLVLLCVMMFAFLVTAAFSVDTAYMQLVKTELRSATDAAAKAAAEELSATQNRNNAIARGIEIGRKNSVAGDPLNLAESDFVFGRSNINADSRFVFQEDSTPINSVRVLGRRTPDSLGGTVPLFFGGLFNVRSFSPSESAVVTFMERDIVVVVDRSGSMLTDRKFLDLIDAMRIFTGILEDSPTKERVGLASYATFASADVQMTDDLELIRTAMARMPVNGLTNISGGMDAGLSIFRNGRASEFVERAMIVLTDGLQNQGRPARLAAQTIAEEGITIHTITFGSDADRRAMKEVADIGKGQTFHAANGEQLKRIFEEIATTFTTIITE